MVDKISEHLERAEALLLKLATTIDASSGGKPPHEEALAKARAEHYVSVETRDSAEYMDRVMGVDPQFTEGPRAERGNVMTFQPMTPSAARERLRALEGRAGR
jgi:hypothetical protein